MKTHTITEIAGLSWISPEGLVLLDLCKPLESLEYGDKIEIIGHQVRWTSYNTKVVNDKYKRDYYELYILITDLNVLENVLEHFGSF